MKCQTSGALPLFSLLKGKKSCADLMTSDVFVRGCLIGPVEVLLMILFHSYIILTLKCTQFVVSPPVGLSEEQSTSQHNT